MRTGVIFFGPIIWVLFPLPKLNFTKLFSFSCLISLCKGNAKTSFLPKDCRFDSCYIWVVVVFILLLKGWPEEEYVNINEACTAFLSLTASSPLLRILFLSHCCCFLYIVDTLLYFFLLFTHLSLYCSVYIPFSHCCDESFMSSPRAY